MDRLDCDRLFVAVVETGSFAAAARRLGISSGQASKLISRLEEMLNVQLLSRTTRALALTEAGRGYFEGIRGLLQEFDALDSAVRDASGSVSGRLRISAPITFGTAIAAPVLMDFAALHPEIEIDVSFSDRMVSLVDEGFDAAIRIGQPEESSLIVRKLCDARVILAAAPDYLERRGTPAHPADLASHDLIIDTNFRNAGQWRFRLPSGGTISQNVQGRLRFSNAEAAAAAAIRGFGIARLPSFVAGAALRDGTLKTVLAAFEDAPYGVHVFYPPQRHLARKVRALVDYLALAFQGQPEWDKGW